LVGGSSITLWYPVGFFVSGVAPAPTATINGVSAASISQQPSCSSSFVVTTGLSTATIAGSAAVTVIVSGLSIGSIPISSNGVAFQTSADTTLSTTLATGLGNAMPTITLNTPAKGASASMTVSIQPTFLVPNNAKLVITLVGANGITTSTTPTVVILAGGFSSALASHTLQNTNNPVMTVTFTSGSHTSANTVISFTVAVTNPIDAQASQSKIVASFIDVNGNVLQSISAEGTYPAIV